jgi:hypothetical protein
MMGLLLCLLNSLVEVTYCAKLHFVINVRIKSDFITNSVKYGVLKSWLQQVMGPTENQSGQG